MVRVAVRRLSAPLVAMALISVVVLLGTSAYAGDTIGFAGEGTVDGACETIETGTPPESVPVGSQLWQFNLTGQNAGNPASLTYKFDDGTQASGVAPSTYEGSTAEWFVLTSVGAKVLLDPDTFATNAQPGDLSVAGCWIGQEPTTTPTAVVAAPVFTG